MNTRLSGNSNLIIHTKNTFEGLPVLTHRGPLIKSYLASTKKTIDNAFAEHSRSCAIRIDLRLPQSAGGFDSSVITRFYESFKAQINADQKKKRKEDKQVHPCTVRYVWARERERSHNCHYHVLVLLNKDAYHCLGNYSATMGNMAARFKKAWASALGLTVDDVEGLVYFPLNPIYNIDINQPGFQGALSELFIRASYLTKVDTKNFGDRSSAFGCSRK